MKTKAYKFNKQEIYVIRDALIEYYYFLKDVKPNSPIAIENKKILEVLKDQFKTDAILF